MKTQLMLVELTANNNTYEVYMKFLMLILLNFSFNAFAAGKCENIAKFGAIRSYMTNVESADRSALTASASFVSLHNGLEQYSVTVQSPCVIEGDDSNCVITYDVATRDLGSKCSVESVKEESETE
jgi:hypothetical protein